MHKAGPFTDTHAHLSMVAARLGRPALEAQLEAYAMHGSRPLILDPGVEANDLGERSRLLAGYAFIRLAAGIWPSREALAEPRNQLVQLERAIMEAGGATAIAAIGEGGLDYHHMNGGKSAQRELFVLQLDLAVRLAKPFIIHSRDAAADTLEILRAVKPPVPVILHCFGYAPPEATAFLELGCYISFAGNLTYKAATALREACALVPPDRFLLETDSPYMNPEPRRGQPSTPLDIERSYLAAAAIRAVSVEELADGVTANAYRLFG